MNPVRLRSLHCGTNAPPFQKYLDNVELMRRKCSCSARSDVVEMVAVLLHTGQDTAAEDSILRLVADVPHRHLALVPHLVALFQELEIEHIADFRVTSCPELLVLVDNTDVHEHLITLTQR